MYKVLIIILMLIINRLVQRTLTKPEHSAFGEAVRAFSECCWPELQKIFITTKFIIFGQTYITEFLTTRGRHNCEGLSPYRSVRMWSWRATLHIFDGLFANRPKRL